MKKKVFKRIGAILLAVAMILTAVPQTYLNVQAEDTMKKVNEFTVTSLNENTEIYNNGSHWRIYLNYEGTFDIGGTWGSGEFLTWLNYTIDDGPIKSAYGMQLYQCSTVVENSYLVFQFGKDIIPTDGTANCKLTIKAGTWNKTKHTTTMTNDVEIYFNENGVTFGEPRVQNVPDMYLTRLTNATNRPYVWLHFSENDEFEQGVTPMAAVGMVDGDWYYNDNENGVWLDNKWLYGSATTTPGGIEFMKATDVANAYRIHPQWFFGSGSNPPIQYGERITIKGLFVAGGKGVNIQNSVIEWHASTGKGTSSDSGTWVILPRLLELAEGTTNANGAWKIYMSHTGQLVGEEGETFTAKATINGEEADVQIYADGKNIVVAPTAEQIADGDKATLTLKAGDITGSAGSISAIVNDVTFYINKHGVSLDGYIAEPETEYIESIYDIAATSKSTVYFKMSRVDAFGETMIIGDEENITPSAMGGLIDGTYYKENGSGIWIDNTWYQPNLNNGNPGLVKMDAIRDGNQQDYYISLWHVQSKINDGTRIHLKGLFGADGKYADIEESVLQWNVAEGEAVDSTNGDWTLLPKITEFASVPTVENGQWKIAMKYVGEFKSEEGEVFTVKAIVGENSYDVVLYKDGDKIVIVPTTEALPIDGTEVTLVLQAGDVIGDKGTTNTIVNDVTICVNKYGASLDEAIPSYTIVDNKLDPKTTYENETWYVYMKQSGSFRGVTENGVAEKFVFQATVGGEETTVDVYAKEIDGKIYFNPIIPDSDALKPEKGCVEFVIKAGVVIGDKGTENELKEDVVLYFHASALSVDNSEIGSVDLPSEAIKLQLTTPISWDTGIYFYTSIAGNIYCDTSWNIRPTSVGGYKDGICYRGDGGIYITDPEGNTTRYAPNNGSKIPTLVKLGKYDDSINLQYYVGINSSQKVEKGTKVTIKGVFELKGSYDLIAPTTVEWNGAEWINVTPADDQDVEFTLTEATGTSKRIYLNATDGFDPKLSAFIDPMPGEGNGVFVNGIRTGVQIYKIGTPYNKGVYHVLLDGQNIEAQVGDEVVIKGRFTSKGHIVEYKEVCFVFNGSKWVASSLPTKQNVSDTTEYDTATSVGFAVSKEDTLAVSAASAYQFTVGGIYINGIYNASAQLYKLGNLSYKIDLSLCGMTFEVGDTVTIDGSVKPGVARTGEEVEYKRTVFTYEGDGVWALTESGIPKEPVRFELNAEESYKAENGDWKLLFTAADGLRGDPGVEADATFSGLTAIVAEQEYAPSFFKNSKSYYEVTIPNGALPSTGGVYEIVIKRGTITGGWEAEAGRYMQKEIVLYVSGDRISDKGTPVVTENVDVSFASGNKSEVNLALNGEDCMVVTTKEGGTIYASNEPNSGVFVNGKKQENLGIFKFEENGAIYYYVPFAGIQYTPAADDVVVVNGTFELANYYVTFNTVAMKWNGSAWEAVSDLSNIVLKDETCDASDSAFIIDTEGTTVDGEVVDSGKVLYKEGEYSVVYAIGNATLSQKLNIVYSFTSANNNGAGKVDIALPDMVTGEANAAGQYITDVKATTHGTTVISMDKENSYQTSADFDDYGLDYVLDINMDSDREFKVLQLSDTQTLDGEQQRYDGRISATLAAQTVPEKQYENLQYYVEKVVAESKPDVILIAGDLIYSEFDDKGSSWLDLIEFMDSLQIPWAPVFGNHDNESMMGIEWQCEQFMYNSTYCLFNRRHEGVGGNGNYSIGLARNGKLEKAIYMFDSNGCGNVAKSGNTYSTWGYDDAGNMTEIRAASGFYQSQIEWYATTAKRVNAVAGEIIPSIHCYHIGTEEVLLAARAAGYQYGEENAANKYAMSNDADAESYLENGKVSYIVRPQTGDSGYKMGSFSDFREAKGMLEIMNEVGTTGAFMGHNHSINTSMSYGGVRWTYGLKTGIYADDTVNKGGTLIKMDLEGDSFTLEQIQVELEYSEPALDAEKATENAADVIFLDAKAIRDAMPVQTEALVVANDEECGIFINAVKSDAKVEKYAEDKYKVTLPKDAKEGDVVSVYGIFENSTGSHAVYFQKTLVVKWDGTQWNRVAVDWLNGSTVTLNTIAVDYSKKISYAMGDGILPTRIDNEGNKTEVPLAGVTTYGETDLKYILDNVTYEQKVVLYTPGDAHVDETLDIRDLVAMKKAENGEASESLTETYAIQLGSKGLREKLAVVSTDKFIITGLNAKTAIYNGGSHWRVYLDYKGYDDAPFNFNLGGNLSSGEYMASLRYSIDNGAEAGSFSMQFYQGENGTIVLQFPSSIIAANGTADNKLTIKAQKKTSSKGTYTYELMDEFTLYFDGTNVSLLP